jgi:ribosome-binding protein aMBF1 (putative translation factor)
MGRVLERPVLEAASSESCVIYRAAPVQASAPEAGYDDFNRLASEVSADPQADAEVARGRAWVAATFGTGDLASLRLAAGLSQSQLAALCNLEQPHVSRYESGLHEPLVSTASKMAKALGVSLDTLVNAWNVSKAASHRSRS